jgi:hypothetical protein
VSSFDTKRLPRGRDLVASDGSDVRILIGLRAIGPNSLAVVAVTMPPWPGDGEAYDVAGPWRPTLGQ